MLTFREYCARSSFCTDALTEGVDDPGILKCVFMAGGPGSGKSHVAGELFGVHPKLQTSFSAFGLKVISSDTIFERLLQQHGISPKILATLHHKPEAWAAAMAIRDRAKSLTTRRQTQYELGRLGVILDGTGDDAAKILQQKQHAETLGYDCLMVFVNTTLEMALARNAARPRTLPENLVTVSWHEAQKALATYRTMFGADSMLIIDNSTDGALSPTAVKSLRRWLAQPVKNPLGQTWIAAMGGRHRG